MRNFKVIVFSMLCLFGSYGAADASSSTIVANHQCRYTVKDATAGLVGLINIGFFPKEKDNNYVIGAFAYHNPNSLNPKSVDAVEVVVLDQNNPGVKINSWGSI